MCFHLKIMGPTFLLQPPNWRHIWLFFHVAASCDWFKPSQTVTRVTNISWFSCAGAQFQENKTCCEIKCLMRERERNQKRWADILLDVGPGELQHRTDLHADGLQGVVITFPHFPIHSNLRDSAVSPPTINTIWICKVTFAVPERPQAVSGTVSSNSGVLVFV